MAEVGSGVGKLSAVLVCAPTDVENALTKRRKSTGPTLSSKVTPTWLLSTALKLTPALAAAACKDWAEGTAPVTSSVSVSKKCWCMAR